MQKNNQQEASGEELEILEAYRSWSEDFYAAGFLSPSLETVREFIEFRKREKLPYLLESYEQEFLKEYFKQKKEMTNNEQAA